MRVGMIAPAWLPTPSPAYGGTEAVVDELCRALTAVGHSVLLVCHPDSTCPVERVSVVPAEDTVRMGRASIELEHAIGAYALVEHCDVVHDHTLAGPIVALGRSTPPVVATNHMPFTRTMSAIFAAACPPAALVAISRSHADSSPVPVAAVVHHGVGIDRYPVGDGRGGYVAVLSRMAPEKGVHRAVTIARAAGVPLRIAAKMREPREREYFDRFVAPHLGDGVEYVGELDTAGKLELLGGAAALLNPIAWSEPFGMAMVEAMACGTPVVGTGLGAAPEIVDDGVTGFLCDTDAAMVDGLRRVCEIDRAACRRRVEEQFSARAMADGYLALYERLTSAA